MENQRDELMKPNNDYFAEDLIKKLDITDPVFAAYEAQDVSRDVGFDFANFQDVVPRALDEIRETKEAYEEIGAEGREHFGDEIADIMFSLINLARHAGINRLPTLQMLSESTEGKSIEKDNTLDAINDIGNHITAVSETEKENSDEFLLEMEKLFLEGMENSILIAKANNFDPDQLLTENVRKYLVRCQAIETLASEDNKQWADLAQNNEIVTYWKKAKVLLK